MILKPRIAMCRTQTWWEEVGIHSMHGLTYWHAQDNEDQGQKHEDGEHRLDRLEDEPPDLWYQAKQDDEPQDPRPCASLYDVFWHRM
jgi:hypothetical protein